MVVVAVDEAVDDGALADAGVSEQHDFVLGSVEAAAELRGVHNN